MYHHRKKIASHQVPIKVISFLSKRLVLLTSTINKRMRFFLRSKKTKKRYLPNFHFPHFKFSLKIPQIKFISPRFLGTAFLVSGVVFLAVPQAFKTPPQTPTRTEVKGDTEITTSINTGPIHIDQKLLANQEASQPPLRIVVPKYDIDLSIVEAPVVNGYWELSETTASHGVGSANPGQLGNTVIFAHAKEKLFLPIRDIKKDDIIYVLTKDRWYRYKVTQSKLVTPDQIEEISQTDDEKLTLFTCSGFLDSKRLIVSAAPYRP
jgi:LPXTG-site transpeptidase (sortase) family protein